MSLTAITSTLPAGRTAPPNFFGPKMAAKAGPQFDLSDRAGMILDVKFFDPNIGFVFAGTSGDLSQSNALILKTTDGGRTWRQVYRSTRLNEIICKASFANNLVGYATVQNNDPANLQQRIVKTVDGGEHWSELPLVTSKAPRNWGSASSLRMRAGWERASEGSRQATVAKAGDHQASR